MRAALILVAIVGCATSSDKAGKQEAVSTGAPGGGAVGGSQTGSGEGAVVPPEKPPPTPLEQQKTDHAADMKTGSNESMGVTRGKGSGSAAVESARASGVLGPTEQGAFQVAGKVTIKKFSSKDLDAAVKTKLDDVQACYDKALEFKDTLAGELTITVANGKATVGKSTVKHAELEKCVVDALASASLPKGKSTLVLAFKRE